MSERCSRKGMTDPQKPSACQLTLCGDLRSACTCMHMVYPPVTRIEADVHMLSRKVVRDSIHGISELWLGPGEMLMADGLYYHSEGGHPVCTFFSVILWERANRPSQSSGTERRH